MRAFLHALLVCAALTSVACRTAGQKREAVPDGAEVRSTTIVVPRGGVPMADQTDSAWSFVRSYDLNGDGVVVGAEYDRGAASFQRLDRNRDGRLTKADFAGGGSFGMSPERVNGLMARGALIRYFQADQNPRDLSLDELEESFQRLDGDGDGLLSVKELAAAMSARERKAGAVSPLASMGPARVLAALRFVSGTKGEGGVAKAGLVKFFRSRDDGDGVWQPRARGRTRPPSGVAAGQPAPDFTLRSPDGFEQVTLSSFAGKRPVALIFGSYT